MKRGKRKSRLPLHLVPIMLGMCGILFASRQLTDPLWQTIVVMVSVAAPLYAGGRILAGLPNRPFERLLVIAGLLLLLLGAAVSFSGLSETLVDQSEVPELIRGLSRWLGMGSLLLGLVTMLFAMGRTGEAIEEIGERFRYLADHMSEGFVLTSPEGTITFINRRFLEMTGLTEGDLLGEDSAQLAERFRLQPVVTHIDRRLRGVTSEYQVSWPVNEAPHQFWVTGTPIYDRRGHLAGGIATFRDITEQHEMSRRLERYTHGLQQLVEDRTQKLRRSENRLRELLLHMNEGFITVDAAFKILFANNRICYLLRLHPDGIIGHNLFDFVEAVGRGRLLDLFEAQAIPMQEHVQQERMQQEFSLIQMGGGLVQVVIGVAPVIEASEDEARYSLVVTDVTELKQMQHQLEVRAAELEARNAELKSIDRAKDGFLSNVTHELRTPLSTIRGYLEMLSAGDLGVMDAAQTNALKVMQRNAQRLSHLIDEMIEFSRMEIKGIQLAKTLFSVNRFVQECVASMQPQILARELVVRIEMDDAPQPIWADRKRLLQALTILLSNAIKFSSERALVRIIVGRHEGGTVTVAVADEGIGIERAYQKRVFDKFFQVDGSLTRNYGGAGIGLSIARTIMQAHGGAIDLESEQGKGSTFTLVLPNAAFDTAPPAELPDQFANLRVLLVEEDSEFRKPVAQFLRRCGCQVDEINNGYEALRMAQEHVPDVILMDEVMADLSGVVMVSRLQQAQETRSIPVVLFVSEESRMPSMQGVAENEVLLLTKPFSSSELLAKVMNACLVEQYEEVTQFLTPAPSGDERPTSVLVIDEDPDLMGWMEMVLKLRNFECHCASDVRQALELSQTYPPSVVLMDWDMRSSSTGDALAALRACEDTRDAFICAVTGVPLEGGAIKGVGAVLHKPFPAEQLIELVCRANGLNVGRR